MNKINLTLELNNYYASLRGPNEQITINSDKYSKIHYKDYLQVERVISAQYPRSEMVKERDAHDELLFIVVHQAYELWFKQIIHELASVHKVFDEEVIEEWKIGKCIRRLRRVVEILKLGVQQITVLETMTPLDFLDFRDYLFPASGFQSFQFRVIECMLGLTEKQRITYNNQPFTKEFNQTEKEVFDKIIKAGSLAKLVEQWLERIPFVKYGDFDFLKNYMRSVEDMISRENKAILESKLQEEDKEKRLRMLGGTETFFQYVFDREKHDARYEAGEVSWSYKATIGALFISLYRDEPILRAPYTLLSTLMDLDETLTSWRSRHAQMVMRMIGNKVGTGGSEGHKYLAKTAEKHQLFGDLFNVATLLIPRAEIIPLPDYVKKVLGFTYNGNNHQAV